MMIEESTTAFYKGVLEWLLAKKAYSSQVQNAAVIKVKYTEVLKDVESVSQKIADFTDGRYIINLEQASSSINK